MAAERVCWTRMQAEAGQQLARIVRRKEVERRTGEGLFFWGVGNPPSRAIPALARAAAVIDVVFSVMKSKPKAADVAPDLILVWRSYVTADGVVRHLPRNVLVTSRATGRGCHYALMCKSDTALDVAGQEPFDPGAFRNYGAGGAVGASQVTALLERCAPDGESAYRVDMRARLTDALWVKLVDPVALVDEVRDALDADHNDGDEWLRMVDLARSPGASTRAPRHPSQPTLFAI